MPDLIPGTPVRLTDHVHRVLAPNPGFMTGPGTNSYLIGRRALTLLDPGPDLPDHIEALLQAADSLGGRITQIVLTHTHQDHSPAARAIAERTGARIAGMAPSPHDPHQDLATPIHQPIAHGNLIDIEGLPLHAIHTPGHVGNHLCYWLAAEKLLFTGDHLINGSTVVIVPPSGDMSAYIDSLTRLLDYDIERIAPGHGDLIHNARALIQYTIHHRRMREEKVLEKLSLMPTANLDTLTPVVYDDVPAALHPVARYSLHAHLIKLHADGKVIEDDGYWTLIG